MLMPGIALPGADGRLLRGAQQVARPERSILIVGGLLVALVAVAIVLVLLIGPASADDFPPDSPEGTLQRYLRALSSGDYHTAEELLSENARKQLPPEGIPGYYGSDLDDARITIVRVDDQGDRVVVYLTVQRFSGSGIDFDRYSYEQRVPLVREDGVWKIDELIYGF